MYSERQPSSNQRYRTAVFSAVITLIIFTIAVPLSALASDKESARDFQKYAVSLRDKPFPVDCAAKHATYFSLTGSVKNQPGLASIGANNSDFQGRHQAMSRQGYSGSYANYVPPDVELMANDQARVNLADVLNTDKPVMLNFIFTTCTTICPVLSASFQQVQELLGERADGVLMLSISIDPEYDTPEKLAEYAKRFDAGVQWMFLTGHIDDIITVEKAFDIFRGSKTNHDPVTFLRGRKAKRWLRMEGFANAAEIVAEYEKLTHGDSSEGLSVQLGKR